MQVARGGYKQSPSPSRPLCIPPGNLDRFLPPPHSFLLTDLQRNKHSGQSTDESMQPSIILHVCCGDAETEGFLPGMWVWPQFPTRLCRSGCLQCSATALV